MTKSARDLLILFSCMGPPGLLTVLRSLGASRHLSGADVEHFIEGKVVAVDGAVWFHEARTIPGYRPVPAVLKVVFERCCRWLRKGVLPVVVLEGTGGGRGARLNGVSHLSYFLASVQPQIRLLLDALGVPVVHASGEAEATCAALVLAGVCDCVATTDADALLFGAPCVLNNLNLTFDGASSCEVWELDAVETASGIDRAGLVAAAFLIGSDYDVRGARSNGLRTKRGVAGVGAKGAVEFVAALRRAGCCDIIGEIEACNSDRSILRRFNARRLRCRGCQKCGHGNIRKALHGLRGCVLCGTSTGCLARLESGGLCQCEGCTNMLSLGLTPSSESRRFIATAIRILKTADGAAGLLAVKRQYLHDVTLDTTIATSLVESQSRFEWRGVRYSNAVAILDEVYRTRIAEKLLPLEFEWTLRKLAAAETSAGIQDAVKRRYWLKRYGFEWFPHSATCVKRGSGAPRAVVKWSNDNQSCVLHAKGRFARLSLVRRCGLIHNHFADRPKLLNNVWNRIIMECHCDIRNDLVALRSWASLRGLEFVPCAGEATGIHIRVLWAEVDTGNRGENLQMLVSREQALRFGNIICNCTGYTQCKLSSYFITR